MSHIDADILAGLKEALALWRHASRAWERRYALDVLRAIASPDIVAALVDEYVADAPTNAALDAIAAELRILAVRLEAFGVTTPETAGLIAVITISGTDIRRKDDMAFILQTGQQVDLTATYQDRHGNAATVESQEWVTSDEAVLTVTDHGDGTATAVAESLGTAQIQLTADARFGDEVSDIAGVLDVEVVAAEAVTAAITPGEPTDAAS